MPARAVTFRDSPSRHDVRTELARRGTFRLIDYHQLEVAPFAQIAKWRCQATGLTVVWSDTPGPISRFCTIVRTEIFNSSGCPHTLEHLTFEGSAKYPQPGLLDAIANRLFTSGTNAATDIDTTTYTCESASGQGTLAILPVYLDHIFFPIFSNETFLTEVYHVDGKGEEGGTVFSEMQGREGSQGDVMDLSLRQALYSKRNAYRSETGGQLDALRRLTLDQIRAYHERMYVPENVTVVVLGQTVDAADLLDTLASSTLPDLIAAGHATTLHTSAFVRPFVESITASNPPMLSSDSVHHVEYADSDESVGQVTLSWIGPAVDDCQAVGALWAIAFYLSSGSASSLAQRFVECDSPLCTNIAFEMARRDPHILTWTLDGVPKDRLASAAGDFLAALEDVCTAPFDMIRMQARLAEWRLDVLQSLEADPCDRILSGVRTDALYGDGHGVSFTTMWNDLDVITSLSGLSPQKWVRLLAAWFVDSHCLKVVGSPSGDLAHSQSEANTARVLARCRSLGPIGLAQLDQALEKAKAVTTVAAPLTALQYFKVPSASDIQTPPIETARSPGISGGQTAPFRSLQASINNAGVSLPYFLQFDYYPSSFVSVCAFLCGPTSEVWPLFVSSLFAMPVQRASGETLSSKQAYQQLDDLAIGFDASTCSEGVLISIRVPTGKYEEAVSWLADTIYGTRFDRKRLANLVEKTFRNLPDMLQDGMGMASDAVIGMCLDKASVVTYQTASATSALAKMYRQRLRDDPDDLTRALNAQRHAITDPSRMRFSVTGNVKALSAPIQPWVERFPQASSDKVAGLSALPLRREHLTPLGLNPARKGVLNVITASQSSFLRAASRGVHKEHKDFAAITVATAMLSATNSFLWNACRGPGLCYGLSIDLNDDAGHLSLSIWQAPNLGNAWTAARTIVRRLAQAKVPIKDDDLITAKSNIIFDWANGLSVAAAAADASFSNRVIYGYPANWTSVFLQQVQAVTREQVLRAVKIWILPLFDSSTSVVGISTSPSMRDQTLKTFSDLGYILEVKMQ